MRSREEPATTAVSVGRRRCIFCGRSNRLTREHAAPVWALEAVQSISGEAPGITYAWFGGGTEPIEWRGAEIKVRRVCGPCNNGWMSELENLAKPIVRPMLAGVSFDLDRETQRALARWGLKTAMVLAAMSPDGSPFSTAELEAVASDKMPTGNVMVWLGRHASRHDVYHSGRWLRDPQPTDPSETRSQLLRGYITTQGLGRVVLQVLHVRFHDGGPGGRHVLHPKPGPWDRALARLWPPNTPRVEWPPSRSFNETGTTLQQLDERFAGW